MRVQLKYNQVESLIRLLEDPIIVERTSEVNHTHYQELATITNTLKKTLADEWHRGNQLTPIHAPFLVNKKTDGDSFIAVRKTHCSSYTPESVELIRQDTGETIVLKANTFDWRYM